MKNFYEKRGLRTYCSEVLVLLLSAFIYAVAFPGFVSEKGLGWLAFFALIPVLAVIRNTSWKAVWIYGFIFGVVFYCFFNYWMPAFHKYALVIVAVIKGGEMILLFLALKAADRLFKKRGWILQAAVWVAYAYLSENWFAGYPYGTICYALYRYLPLAQLSEITGIWGIIFLMLIPQTWAARYVSDIFLGADPNFVHYLKTHFIFPIIYAVVFFVWLVSGIIEVNAWEKAEPDRLWRVATIQHNHDSWQGGLETYKRNFSNLRRLSLEAIRRDPDIVVWSETAFIPSVDWHTTYSYDDVGYLTGNAETAELVNEFVAFGEELGLPLLTGNPRGVLKDPDKGPIDLETGELNREDYNTVILFDEGRIKTTYEKQHLVPFTEHFPYEKQMPWLYNLLLANDYNWWLKGDESVVFDVDGVKFSTPICFEDVFGIISADFVRAGANLIVNMTNDRWSGSPDAAMQHAAIGAMRSVETRKTTVRSTNSGLTCMIMPTGQIVDPVEQFRMTWHIYDVPIYETETYGETFYVRHTDIFAKAAIYVSGIFLIAGFVWAALSRIKKGREEVE